MSAADWVAKQRVQVVLTAGIRRACRNNWYMLLNEMRHQVSRA